MKKRFTDTEKWRDPWFRKLSPKMKCAWIYLLDTCDNCGVWKCDYDQLNFNICSEITENELHETFDDRIYIINSEKIWIKNFIFFQAGKLSEACKPHKQILELLEMHNILEVFKGYTKGIYRLQEKEKEKEEEEEREIHVFSEYENLKITEKEYEKLTEQYEAKDLDNYFLKLNNYIVNGKNGKRYKSHYLALLTWMREAGIKKLKKQKQCPKCKAPMPYNTCDCGYRED